MQTHLGFYGASTDFGTGKDIRKTAQSQRGQLAQVLGRPCQWMAQEHGTQVFLWQRDTPVDLLPVADAIIVDARGVSASAPAAAVVTADCLPILLWSPDLPIWAAVHAGRVGLEKGVIARTLEVVHSLVGTQIYAAIGPAICTRCYQVDWECADSFPAAYVQTNGEVPHLDLRGYARHELAKGAELIMDYPQCTRCSLRWHSHRRDADGQRNAALIWRDTDSDMPSDAGEIWVRLT
ncbi:polyphenol oxidase family protein [Actinomycetaceae bacterium WB03_NA08]|uniref:Polyphenol oxidase family protein n=1 Tax=Scrofimicrobium canadense TaxID=2652290 RepID=A0A6N7W544_9ACTO|nr:polyphenol oxidase family protein [Scrofimicrobium canadense]MSS83623.1 polyphenol oxidase family protein [Scrofimicrobium canadense]